MNNLNDRQIVSYLDDIPSDSDVSGASDDSVADETYQPPLCQLQPDFESSDEDEDKLVDIPDIPEDVPEDVSDQLDVSDQPDPSGGDRIPLLRRGQPSKKRRVS